MPKGAPGHERQKLSDLVAWFIDDKSVAIRFVPNVKMTGRLCPEYDHQYFMEGRRVTERGLAMSMLAEFQRRNYACSLSHVIAALTEHAWRHYVATVDYPEWMIEPVSEFKRPRGRPRKHPEKIELPDLEKVGDRSRVRTTF